MGRRGAAFVLVLAFLASPARAARPTLARLYHDILLGAARNSVSLADIAEALRRFGRLIEWYPEETDGRVEYAGILATRGQPKEAVKQYEAVILRRPADRVSRERVAVLYLRSRNFARAEVHLAWIVKHHPRDWPNWSRLADARAGLERRAEAYQIYETVLANLPRHATSILGQANVLTSWFRPHKALALVGSLPARERATRSAWMTEARAHVLAGSYAQARTIYSRMLTADPADEEVRLALAGCYETGDRFPEARAEYRKVLDASQKNREARLGLVTCAVRQRRYSEAGAHLVELAPGGSKDVAPLLLLAVRPTRIATSSGLDECPDLLSGPRGAALVPAFGQQVQERDQLLGRARAAGALRSGEAMREAILAASIFLGRGQLEEAIRSCESVMAVDADNPCARLRRAEALCSDMDVARHRQGIAAFDQLLSASPENIRARLGRARAVSVARRFREAYAEYTRLLIREPAHSVALRELARVHFWESGYSGARRHYAAAASPGSEVALETRAKELREIRPRHAVPVFRELVEKEPDNDEARFDLAQLTSGLRLTRQAQREYEELLSFAPAHRLSIIAHRRGELELAPQASVDGSHFRQTGRGILANIRRTLVGVTGYVPIGDEEESVGVAYAHARYTPSDDTPLNGNIYSVRAQRRPSEKLAVFGQANLEDFASRFSSRVTYNAGASYTFDDETKLGLELFRENVAENGETMRQDIHRAGGRLSAFARPSRVVDVAASYAVAGYADSNTMRDLGVSGSWRLTRAPRRLSAVAAYTNTDFSSGTVFGADPNVIAGILHPYFSPADFETYKTGLEWRQWLTKDLFRGADEIWYEVGYAHKWDDRGEGYDNLTARLNWDIVSRLSLRVDSELLRSSVYNSDNVAGHLVYRF